jgi:ubiquinone/menaquinone biosynthesis C-methylase UbiE
MTLRVDPEKNEVRALKQMVDWRGKRVLEIGCGDGRLTRRLVVHLGAQVDALDPDKKLIMMARKELPARYSDRVRFKVGSAEKLKYPKNTFDIVVFAWSL